jgi:hypothetical protein
MYSLKRTPGGFDGYNEPDHDRDLLWGIHKKDGLDLDPGAIEEIPRSGLSDSVAGEEAERVARATGNKVTYLEPGSDKADLFD